MHQSTNITGNIYSNFHNAGIFDFGHLQHIDFQRLFSYKNALTFTGKEKDSETGFYYFGARYYDPSLSGLFLSVDPMADKYPSISPYAYCAWNPVKLVDPDGKDWYDLYSDGRLVRNDEKSIKYQDRDIIYSVKTRKTSDVLALGTISEQNQRTISGFTGSDIKLGKNREDNVYVFQFCADNTDVEFSLMEFNYDGTVATHLTTSHDVRSADRPSTDNFGSELAKENSQYIISHLHNHFGSASPSVYYDETGEKFGDLSFRDAIIKRRNTSDKPLPEVRFGIYKCTGKNKYTKDYDGNLIDPITMEKL